jgi:hypothetical protein
MNYEEIITELAHPLSEQDINYIGGCISDYIDEYCPSYSIKHTALLEANKLPLISKIKGISENGNSLFDMNWVHEVIEGYYPKDETWIKTIEWLNENRLEEKSEIFSDNAERILFIDYFENRRVELESNTISYDQLIQEFKN